MKLPKLKPLAKRQEVEVGDKERWKPTWNCFCCQDTGKVRTHLVSLVIPEYNPNRDRFPICQNCHLGESWIHLEGNYDLRLTPDICQELDRFAREGWKKTRRDWHENQKSQTQFEQEFQQLTQSKNLRKRDRSPEEEMFVTQHSQNVRENLELEIKPKSDEEKQLKEVEI